MLGERSEISNRSKAIGRLIQILQNKAIRGRGNPLGNIA
jgi:hypothetical protein